DHEGTVKIWDVETGREQISFRVNRGLVGGAAFSPDGRRIFTCAYGAVKAWDAETGREELSFRGPINIGSRLAVSPDGRRIAVTDGDTYTVRVWDAQTGRELAPIRPGTRSLLWCLAYSSDGRRIAAGLTRKLDTLVTRPEDHYGTVQVWDAETGREL